MADEDKLEQETFEIAELYQEQTESSYNQALKRIGKNKDLAKIIHPEVGTLLHLACKYNLLSHVKVLVKNDADVNAHGGKLKNKPLHDALFNPNKVKRKVSRRSQHNESFEIVKHLLDNGADLNSVKDLLGHTSLAATQIYTNRSIEEIKKVFKKTHPRNK